MTFDEVFEKAQNDPEFSRLSKEFEESLGTKLIITKVWDAIWFTFRSAEKERYSEYFPLRIFDGMNTLKNFLFVKRYLDHFGKLSFDEAKKKFISTLEIMISIQEKEENKS